MAFASRFIYLLWAPVLVPQIAGTGDPPVTMNWSDSHLWSTLSGWARIMFSTSNLPGRGKGSRIIRK